MPYTIDYDVEIQRTQMRAVERTVVDVHYRFATDVKMEKRADAYFGLKLRRRIARKRFYEDVVEFPRLVNRDTIGQYFRDREGLRQSGSLDNNKTFSNEKFSLDVSYQMSDAFAFDLHIVGAGRIELEDLIDFDSLDEFVYTGNAELLKKPEKNSGKVASNPNGGNR